MQPRVSIITINYNQLAVTCEFLASTRLLSYPNFEVIVVDNASQENGTDYLQLHFPDVKVIRSEKNLGFAGGNNLGIAQATGEYLLFVNNDTEVGGDFLEQLVASFEADPSVGVVCPKIKYFDAPDTIQYAGFTAINPLTGRNKAIGHKQKDSPVFSHSSFTHYAHGAAMMVKLEVIEHVGPMTDVYFLYYEEMDWSEAIRRAGYKILYQPSTFILHKESVSTGKESPLKAYYHTRNRILFMRRNTAGWQFFCFMLYFSLLVTPKSLATYLVKRKFEHLQSFIKGYWWHVAQLFSFTGVAPKR